MVDNYNKVITVDGPSGVGKGTISRGLAMALGWRWLDSGALYRLTALAADRLQIALDDVPALVDIAKALDVSFSVDTTQDDPDIILAGEVVNAHIRTENCGNIASKIAAYPAVREALLQRQRDFLTEQGLIADGRDMGTIIFPEAPMKVYLTASAEVRAARRHRQLRQQGVDVNMSRLLEEITHRDARDRQRTIAPLVPADDAIVIDTSDLTIAEVLNKVLAEARQRGLV